MPEISILGWFHTIIAIVALGAGLYSLIKFKYIKLSQLTGKIYLGCTLFAAVTALFIYQASGTFNAAHALAILTLLALLVGFIAEKTGVFGKLSQYLQATSYTGTFLFHMIPAITDGLMRLPVDSPIVSDIEDPLLKGFYLAFFIVYIVVLITQIMSIRKQAKET